MMRALPLLFAAALLVGCGASPAPKDPCKEGRCGASPIAPTAEAGPGRLAPDVEEESEVQTWDCREPEHPTVGQPAMQCRVRLGPFRFAVSEGPNGTVVSALNTGAQPLDEPRRRRVEGERGFDGHR